MVDAVAELLAGAAGEIVACGLDHQGESVLAWDADERPAPDPDRDLAGQALAGGARPPRGATGAPTRCASAAACRSTRTSRPASSPGCSSTTPRWPGSRRRHGTARHRRLLPLRPARRRVRDRPLDRLAHRSSGAPDWDPALLEIFGVPAGALPAIADTAGDLGMLRHPAWPVELPLRARCVDQQAALAGAGCVEPGLVKATYGTGVFVLAHAGDERPEPGGGLLPTVAWRVDGRGRVGDRRRRVHRRRAARVAQPRPRARGRPAALAAARGRGRGRRRRSRPARRSPASARRGGSPRRAAVVAGLTVGHATGPHRAGRAGGDRLAGGGRGGRRARDGARRGPARRRRPDARLRPCSSSRPTPPA